MYIELVRKYPVINAETHQLEGYLEKHFIVYKKDMITVG